MKDFWDDYFVWFKQISGDIFNKSGFRPTSPPYLVSIFRMTTNGKEKIDLALFLEENGQNYSIEELLKARKSSKGGYESFLSSYINKCHSELLKFWRNNG